MGFWRPTMFMRKPQRTIDTSLDAVFLVCALLCLIGSQLPASDLITVLAAEGRQCSSGAGVNTQGKIGMGIQDSTGALDFVLLNTDGTVQLSRRLTGNGAITVSSLAVAKDGGFIAVGGIATASNGTDAFIAKFSAAGNVLWKRIIGTPEDDEFRALAVLNDGSIVVLGHRNSATTTLDLLLAKFSAGGAVQWRKVIGTSGFEHAGGIAVFPDNTIGIAAGTEVNGSARALFIKINPAGTILSARIASTPNSTGLFFLPHLQDGSLMGFLAPLVQGAAAKTFVGRFDTSGAKIWLKSFGVAGKFLITARVFQKADGSFFLTGASTAINSSAGSGVIAKISSAGTFQWKRGFSMQPGSTALTSLSLHNPSQTIIAAGCVGFGTDKQDTSLVQVPVSGTISGCSALPSIGMSTSNATVSFSNLAISTLSAAFHVQTPPLSSATLSITRSTQCHTN